MGYFFFLDFGDLSYSDVNCFLVLLISGLLKMRWMRSWAGLSSGGISGISSAPKYLKGLNRP